MNFKNMNLDYNLTFATPELITGLVVGARLGNQAALGAIHKIGLDAKLGVPKAIELMQLLRTEIEANPISESK